MSYAPSTCTAEQYTSDERDSFAARKATYDAALAAHRTRERAAAHAAKQRGHARGGVELVRGGALEASSANVSLPSNNTFVDDEGDVKACGGGEFSTCDDAYMPSCTCRYGDSETHFGQDYFCDFGTCFSPDCVDYGLKNFSCSFTAVSR